MPKSLFKYFSVNALTILFGRTGEQHKRLMFVGDGVYNIYVGGTTYGEDGLQG